ncbi:hypothetical protein ACJX0J_019028 [Zea mays]
MQELFNKCVHMASSDPLRLNFHKLLLSNKHLVIDIDKHLYNYKIITCSIFIENHLYKYKITCSIVIDMDIRNNHLYTYIITYSIVIDSEDIEKYRYKNGLENIF